MALVCLPLIMVLDNLADLRCTGRVIDKVIKQIITANGLLVGFSWEQSFDASVSAIASRSASPEATKFCLACFCGLLVLPAWVKFMLPMSIQGGWRFGFIPENATKHLAESGYDFKTGRW